MLSLVSHIIRAHSVRKSWLLFIWSDMNYGSSVAAAAAAAAAVAMINGRARDLPPFGRKEACERERERERKRERALSLSKAPFSLE